MKLSEEARNIRFNRIKALVDDIKRLKSEAINTAKIGYLSTLLWAIAVDITTIDSVRWERHGISERVITKEYNLIAPNSYSIITRCRTLHEQTNTLFPTVPDRYTARFIVMQYIICPEIESDEIVERLQSLRYVFD